MAMGAKAVAATGSEGDLFAQVKGAIRRVAPNAEVILFGSRARGNARPDSDYDLLVLTDQPVSLALEERIREQEYPIELETGAVLALLPYGKAAWSSPRCQAMPLHAHVQRHGVTL
jgi:predicted nucleotidyltransferase